MTPHVTIHRKPMPFEAEFRIRQLEQDLGQALDRYDRLNAECAEAHRQVWMMREGRDALSVDLAIEKLRSKRNRRAFLMASVIAGVMGLLAIAGWLK